MEDYHVDRPDVEAQQCVKLTGTNSSIGLIVLITNGHSYRSRQLHFVQCLRGRAAYATAALRPQTECAGKARKGQEKTSSHAFRRPGGYCEVAAPDPIPNSVVKRLCANGTLS